MRLDFSVFDTDFGVFEILFIFIVVIVVGFFILTAVQSISTWNRNNHSPRLTVSAVLVSKRISVTHHNSGNVMDGGGDFSSTSTTYYVTFQVESGDRMEFRVRGSEYGMLCEGDIGKLSFQGTRYESFERNGG